MDPTSKSKQSISPTFETGHTSPDTDEKLKEKSLATHRDQAAFYLSQEASHIPPDNVKANFSNREREFFVSQPLHSDSTLSSSSTSSSSSSAPSTGSTSPAVTAPSTSAATKKTKGIVQQTVASSVKFGKEEQKICYSSLSIKAKLHAFRYGLSNMESAAINAYSRDEYYGDINKQFRLLPLDKVDLSDPEALKRAGVTNSDLAMLISALVTGMKKLPPAQADDSIFEALGRNVILPQEELALYQEGNIVPMKTFISTTVSQQEMVTEHWWDNKDLALFIYQSVGGNGRDISLFSHFAKEKEILFLPNTKFEVMFRGAPSLTEPGLHPDGTPKPNPKGPKVTKTLITLVEVPADKPAAAKPEKKNPPPDRATYFSLR